MIYLAARALGCDADTVHNYRKRFKAVDEVCRSARGQMIDAAESALYRSILAGEAWGVTFALKTIGRDRGYGEIVEHTGEVNHNVKLNPIDRARQLLAELVRPALANGRLNGNGVPESLDSP